MKILIFVIFFSVLLYAREHILITEIVVTPTEGEFIEIYNNTNQTIDLSNYYLTDATFSGSNTYYYNIVTGTNAGGGGFADFHARFPAGSSISAGEFQTIAINGSDFVSTYSIQPTYELYETNASIPNMREALAGTINNQGTLTNDGEIVVIYYWDEQSDLVQDIDYIIWGDKNEGVDKTGVSIDGPDDGSNPSTYFTDTPIAQQIAIASGQPHSIGESVQRVNLIETDEIQSGGNGITNHNETSENLAVSFQVGTPNPGSGPGEDEDNAPQITNVFIDPQIPRSGDRVTVNADITDDGVVSSVELFSAINTLPFDSTSMVSINGNTYQAIIDSQETGTTVYYFVRAQDDSGLIAQTDTFFYTVSGPDTITKIFDIQNDDNFIGRQVTVQGIVIIGSGVTATDWTDVYVQDNSGRGINVYRSGTPLDENFIRGNLVQVRGTVDEYEGITEIVNYSVQVLAQNQQLPPALLLSTQIANDLSYEGTLIKVQGIVTEKYTAGPGTNILINDGSGAITIRAWDSAGLSLDDFNVGDTISVSGVLDIYVDPDEPDPGKKYEPQILLVYQEDIYKTTIATGVDGSGIVTVVPDSVGVDELVTLSFTVSGTSPDTVTRIRITIPDEWLWTGLSADLSFSGSPFDAVESQVEGNQITLSKVNLINQSTGNATISNLTTPDVDTLSVFLFSSAGTGGTLSQIATSPAILVGSGTSKTIVSIAEIQNNIELWKGQQVTIRGVVTIGSGILITSRTEAYVQDASGIGIQVFSFDSPDANLIRGNLGLITGIIEDYEDSRGDFTTEITDYDLTVLQKDVELPIPVVLTTDQATNGDLEGAYIEVTGTIIDKFSAGEATNIVLDDGSGEVTLRVWDTAEIDLSNISVGNGISARGVISQFGGGGQVLIGYQEDLSFVVVPTTPTSLKIPAKPFAPDQGEQLSITYSAGSENAYITLRIYDLGGRLITTLIDEKGRSFEQRLDWDGTDRLNEQVPVGVYILHMEVVNELSGKRIEKTAPIVIGTVISR